MGSRSFSNADYRRSQRRSQPVEPPLFIEAAAAALMRAFEKRWGFGDDAGGVDTVWIGRTHIGASYSDGSSGGLVRWRSEAEAERGRIPQPASPDIKQLIGERLPRALQPSFFAMMDAMSGERELTDDEMFKLSSAVATFCVLSKQQKE